MAQVTGTFLMTKCSNFSNLIVLFITIFYIFIVVVIYTFTFSIYLWTKFDLYFSWIKARVLNAHPEIFHYSLVFVHAVTTKKNMLEKKHLTNPLPRSLLNIRKLWRHFPAMFVDRVKGDFLRCWLIYLSSSFRLQYFVSDNYCNF